MNDSLKEIIKEVIKDFFIITVAMLFVVSLANSIALIEYYPLFSVGCNGNRCGNFNSDSAFLL